MLKGGGIALGLTGFFVAYFAVLNHPVFPVRVVPATVIDRMVDFNPAWLLSYASLWLYVCLAPALLVGRREVIGYAIATSVLSAVGLAVFVLWPTTIEPPLIDWDRHPAVGFLKTVDASGNAFPSLHVAFAVFTAVSLERLLRQLMAGRLLRAGNLLWALAITYSTLAVKQHVAWDLLGGAVLGLAVAAAHQAWLRRVSGTGLLLPQHPHPVGFAVSDKD